jgi:hypothetical protein
MVRRWRLIGYSPILYNPHCTLSARLGFQVGTTGKLCEQLSRELRSFRSYREELNELASTVDVQPLFSSYAELLQVCVPNPL